MTEQPVDELVDLVGRAINHVVGQLSLTEYKEFLQQLQDDVNTRLMGVEDDLRREERAE